MKKLLSIVLSILMVVTMLPMNVLTASAAEDGSDGVIYFDLGPWANPTLTALILRYSSDNSTINEIMMEEASYNIWKADVSTNNPAGWRVQFVGSNLSIGTVIPAGKNCFRITGYNSSSGGYDGVWYQYPCTSHDYKDGICACGEVCFHANYTDGKCDVCGYECPHESCTYTANGNIITATCSANCGYTGTATITAENATYNGTEQETASVSYSEGWTGGELTVSYENNINAGTATASITVGEATASVDFTITKAYYNLTAPTPNTLTYNGEKQNLVSAGAVEGADFEYCLDGVSWSRTIPQAKDVGDYTVYYRVLADENHYGVEGTVDVTIKECPHEWNDGVLTRPERITTTEWDDGYYTYTCTLCGAYYHEAVKRADYTAFEAVMTDYIDIVNNKSVFDSVKDELSSIYQQNREVTGGNRIETEQAEVDAVVKLLSDKIDEIKAKIEDGTDVKADYTEIDGAVAGIDEALENATISEEMANELSDIKSQLEELKENENTSMADVIELLVRTEAIAETMNNCANGVHSFIKYNETEAPKCGVAGKENATCDNGCGATDEKEIPALTHKDTDGDYLCDNGCGHEFEKPAEPDTPDEPTDDVCEDCGKVHNGFFSEIICFFTRIINFIKNLFA